jgi:CTP:molybdopterin cytidylyltransferase MocA
MSFVALVLAAGRSVRMGQPKAFLRLGSVTLLEHVVAAARGAGADRVVVVVGAADDPSLVNKRRAAELLGRAVTFALGAPDRSQIESLQRGLAISPVGPLLVWPVDHPFADAELVQRLLAALPSAEHIALPRTSAGRGHPVLFGARVRRELMEPGLVAGARSVVHRDSRRVIEVPCDDARLSADVDTPAEALALGLTL